MSAILARAMLLAALPLCACVSLKHKPEQESLVSSADCTVVVGDYQVDDEHQGRELARLLFDNEGVSIGRLAIEKDETRIGFHATATDGTELSPLLLHRIHCAKNVLKVVLRDQHSADGLVSAASDRILELFAADSGSLNLRFIDTSLGFVFIVPAYSSTDKLVRLRRVETD